MMGRRALTGSPIPAADTRIGQADEIEHTVDAGIDQVVDGLRVVIKAWDGRRDDGAISANAVIFLRCPR